MEFASPFITPIFELFLVPIKRHLGFLLFSPKYVTEMREKFEVLNSAVIDMKRRKERNDENSLVVPDLVPSWLKRAEEIINMEGDRISSGGNMERVEEIINMEGDAILAGENGCLHIKRRYKACKHCFKVNQDKEGDRISAGGIGCLHVNRRYKVGKQSSNLIKRIVSLLDEKEKMEWTDYQIPLDIVSSATPQVLEDVTQNIFDSRKEIFQRALQLLEPDNPTQMVALCGMGGVGKTTMMEQLKEVVRNRKLFDRVVRVVIGNSTDPIAYQGAIAQYTGEDLSVSNKEARADHLKERFSKMSQDGKKKILIILDDLWNKVELKDIGLASPLPKGFKLFLTSRYEMVCLQMGVETGSIMNMVGLEEAEAIQLFWETTRPSDGSVDHHLRKLGEDIVKRCDGLPMAIKTIALALTGQIQEEWELTLSRLEQHDLQDLYAVAHHVFEISYDYLKNDDFKEIFILSGLFPDDFDILLEDLMRYGWGLKLFNNVHSLAEARRRTNTSVHNLIRANLLNESDKKGCVRMHDLARSFVLSNISKFKQASIVNHGDMSEWPATRESCERILLNCQGMSEFPGHFDYPNLRLLKLMMEQEIQWGVEEEPLMFPQEFYTRMKTLQVISYHGIQYPSLVPISLQCSTSLRVLCLYSWYSLGDLSYLGHLSNLEILSFAYCGIKNLPSTIGNLRKLKLLDLRGSNALCIGDGIFQNLDNLEELYMSNSYYKVISFTEDNCQGLEMVSNKLTALEIEFYENNVRPKYVSFKKLERFRISIGCRLDDVSYNDYYSYENTFRLVASCEEVRAFEINQLFEKTEKLHLQVEDMNHLEDVLMHPPSDQYSFCNFKHLSFNKCKNLKYLFTVNAVSTLTNLESLRISSCRLLGSLIHDDENSGGEVIKFHKLKRLELVELPMFVGLCDKINIVMELLQLVELILADLPHFTCIFASSDNIPATTLPLFNKEVASRKLEKLDIWGMKNLKEIWACEEENDRTPVFKEITVNQCDMQNLFPKNPMRLLSHLEKLTVNFCGSIEALFDIDSKCVGQFTSSLRSIHVCFLRDLREVWRIRDEGNSAGLLIHDFQALECIQIHDCYNFRDIVTPTTIKFDMVALTTIKFESSGGRWGGNNSSNESIQDEEFSVPWSLGQYSREMKISRCHALSTVIPSYAAEQPQKIELLEIDECSSLIEVFETKELKNSINIGLGSGCSDDTLVPSTPRPKSIITHKLPNLKTLDISNCHRLVDIFTLSTLGSLGLLKKLSISCCKDLQLIVREEHGEQATTSKVVIFPCLKSIILYDLPNLKGFFSRMNEFQLSSLDTQMPNLKILDIQCCHQLVDIFTFSTFGSLRLLEKLRIKDCEDLKVIVREEHGKQTMTTSKAVIFSRLKSVILAELPNLKGFFFGMNEFQLPILDEVIITGCPQMMVFTPLPLRAPNLKYIYINDGKYSPPECCSFFMTTTLPRTPSQSSDSINLLTTISEEFLSCFHSLIEKELYVWEHQVIFSYDELLQLQNLEKLHARGCESVHEVFEIGTGGVGCSNSSPTVVKLPKLSDVRLWNLKSLKYIWKSNGRTRLEFPKLTVLRIYSCYRLKHVFTSSMVGRLLQLKDLTIYMCRDMKVIIKEDQEEEGGDIHKVNEMITLPCLKSIKLEGLDSLEGFCLGNVDYSLPSLEHMKIEGCKSLTIFTKGRLFVPELKVLETNLGAINLAEEDVNSFIITKTQEFKISVQTVNDSDEEDDDSKEEDDDGDVGEGPVGDEDDDAKEEDDDGTEDKIRLC